MNNTPAPVAKLPREERNVGTYINMEDAERLLMYANWACEKKVAPKNMDQAQYFMILQAGMGLQMNVMQVRSSLCIVNGRVSIYWPETIARASRAGYIVTPVEETKEKAVVEIVIEGRKPYTATFTKEDADLAGLTVGDRAAIWKKYPKDMLFWKAAARAIRKYAPEVLGGYDMAEDVQELQKPEGGVTITAPDLGKMQVIGIDPALPGGDQTADIKSLETIDLAADTGNTVQVTGTTTIEPPAPKNMHVRTAEEVQSDAEKNSSEVK